MTASFAFSCLQGGTPQLGSEFSCDVSSGEVAPGSSLRATVHYSPVVVDTVAVDYLTLVCPGALNKIQLKLTGTCIGMWMKAICRYKLLAVNHSLSYELIIHNHSRTIHLVGARSMRRAQFLQEEILKRE